MEQIIKVEFIYHDGTEKYYPSNDWEFKAVSSMHIKYSASGFLSLEDAQVEFKDFINVMTDVILPEVKEDVL